MYPSLPAKAMDLIPHRAGMMLIDTLISFSEDDASAILDVKDSSLFVDKKQQLDSIVFIELLAQAAAAHSGYKAKYGRGEAKFGFLVGVKDLNILGLAKDGQQLFLKIHRDFQMENVSFLNGKVFNRNALLAEGVLKLWEMPATEVEAQQIQVTPDMTETFKQFTKTQMTIIEASFLNQQIVQYCTDFKSAAESGTVDAEFCFQKNFIGFDGHFPGNPIVPGVLVLKAGLLLAELANEQAFTLRNIRTAKFAKTVLPNESIHYTLSIKENQIKVQVKAQDALCAKFTLEVENRI